MCQPGVLIICTMPQSVEVSLPFFMFLPTALLSKLLSCRMHARMMLVLWIPRPISLQIARTLARASAAVFQRYLTGAGAGPGIGVGRRGGASRIFSNNVTDRLWSWEAIYAEGASDECKPRTLPNLGARDGLVVMRLGFRASERRQCQRGEYRRGGRIRV